MAAKSDSPYITTGEKVRSFIGWAFLISVAVHFLLAPIFPNLRSHNKSAI